MAIQVPADLEVDIREKVASGRFETEADVVREALRLLDRREKRVLELRTSIESGLEAVERGEGIELTDDLWDQLSREAELHSAQGYRPKSDVLP
ncbi:MAG: type II toxin-antitoxin system ParD family antitoxin [Thermomicrobiales bacterium]